MIRVYGIDKGNASWARVTAGVCKGTRMLAQFAGLFDVSQVDGEYGDDSLGRGHDSLVGLCVGPPPAASVMVGRGNHKERLLMIATNSNWLPDVMMERAAKMVTGFVGTSRWASDVIKNYAGSRPVYTYLHGVDSRFKAPQDYPQKVASFSVLHLASTHMQRKSTRELIFAWAMAKRRPVITDAARLTLVVDGPEGYFSEAISEASDGDTSIAQSIVVQGRLNLSVEQMAKLYCSHHFVCQPSRAEGFGLVPLEARACGIPVIATACTGHADHINVASPGVIVVEHGEPAPVDDGPGAVAPTVSPSAIADAIGEAYKDWPRLTDQAEGAVDMVTRQWNWTTVTANFLVEHGSQLGLVDG